MPPLPGEPSRHVGKWWVGTYERRPDENTQPGTVQGDGPQGTLTSQPFLIPAGGTTVSFLLGGGCDILTTYAELLVDGLPARKATGRCSDTMERVVWNVTAFAGMAGQLRFVDASSGGARRPQGARTRQRSPLMHPPTHPPLAHLSWTGNTAAWGHINFDDVRFDWAPEAGPSDLSHSRDGDKTVAAGAAYVYRRRSVRGASTVRGRGLSTRGRSGS